MRHIQTCVAGHLWVKTLHLVSLSACMKCAGCHHPIPMKIFGQHWTWVIVVTVEFVFLKCKWRNHLHYHIMRESKSDFSMIFPVLMLNSTVYPVHYLNLACSSCTVWNDTWLYSSPFFHQWKPPLEADKTQNTRSWCGQLGLIISSAGVKMWMNVLPSSKSWQISRSHKW